VGAYRQVVYGSIPVGAALAGVLGEVAGSHAAVALGAAGLELSALPMLTQRVLALATPQAATSPARNSNPTDSDPDMEGREPLLKRPIDAANRRVP
jgi:hypothetical protein